MAPPLEVLVVGGGIAGPVFAWWLKKGSDASITVIEKAPAPRVSGQAVDIRDAAVDIIKRMGLEAEIKSKHTSEMGMEVVDGKGKAIGKFPASGDAQKQSMTSEYEILRGDLAQIFYDATKDQAKWVFDEYVTGIEQLPNGKVQVEFANNLPKRQYDLVVISDGMISKTRRLVFGKGPNDDDYLKKLGQYGSYFTVPRIESDTKWAQWHNAPKGRMIMMRPDCYGATRAYLFVTDTNLNRFEKFDKALEDGLEAQKEIMKEEFKDVEFTAPRLIKEINDSPDYYYQVTAQVKMKKFVKGNIALLGDTAWAPSPISGMGTTSAILGSYVLAGEISRIKSSSEIPRALEQYQSVMLPFVQKIQKLLLGAPQTFNPQNKWAISLLNVFVMAASATRKLPLGFLIPAFAKDFWKPPQYTQLTA